ncbi:hypothetical protein D3C81_2053940 [compost metagenome]
MVDISPTEYWRSATCLPASSSWSIWLKKSALLNCCRMAASAVTSWQRNRWAPSIWPPAASMEDI